MLCLFTEPHVIRDMEVHVFIPSVETNPRLLRKTIPDLPPYPAFRSKYQFLRSFKWLNATRYLPSTPAAKFKFDTFKLFKAINFTNCFVTSLELLTTMIQLDLDSRNKS